jgi:dCMP deaminase
MLSQTWDYYGMNTTKWDNRFIELAKLVGSWSKDPSTQVGAVIVDDDHVVVSLGYNGFPRGVEDSEERLIDRDKKYDIIVHAEANALMFAKTSLEGCTLYTWPFEPCSRCAGLIIQSGITRVVSVVQNDERWKKNFMVARQLFNEAGIILEWINE